MAMQQSLCSAGPGGAGASELHLQPSRTARKMEATLAMQEALFDQGSVPAPVRNDPVGFDPTSSVSAQHADNSANASTTARDPGWTGWNARPRATSTDPGWTGVTGSNLKRHFSETISQSLHDAAAGVDAVRDRRQLWIPHIAGPLRHVRKSRGAQRRPFRFTTACSGMNPEDAILSRHEFDLAYTLCFSCDNKACALKFAEINNSQQPCHVMTDFRHLFDGEGHCVVHNQKCDLSSYKRGGVEQADLFSAGISCRGYSMARTGRREDWTRHQDSWMIDQYLQSLLEQLPLAAVLENVLGFMKKDRSGESPFARMMMRANELGLFDVYHVRVHVTDSAEWLVWVKRRVYIVFVKKAPNGPGSELETRNFMDQYGLCVEDILARRRAQVGVMAKDLMLDESDPRVQQWLSYWATQSYDCTKRKVKDLPRSTLTCTVRLISQDSEVGGVRASTSITMLLLGRAACCCSFARAAGGFLLREGVFVYESRRGLSVTRAEGFFFFYESRKGGVLLREQKGGMFFYESRRGPWPRLGLSFTRAVQKGLFLLREQDGFFFYESRKGFSFTRAERGFLLRELFCMFMKHCLCICIYIIKLLMVYNVYLLTRRKWYFLLREVSLSVFFHESLSYCDVSFATGC